MEDEDKDTRTIDDSEVEGTSGTLGSDPNSNSTSEPGIRNFKRFKPKPKSMLGSETGQNINLFVEPLGDVTKRRKKIIPKAPTYVDGWISCITVSTTTHSSPAERSEENVSVAVAGPSMKRTVKDKAKERDSTSDSDDDFEPGKRYKIPTRGKEVPGTSTTSAPGILENPESSHEEEAEDGNGSDLDSTSSTAG